MPNREVNLTKRISSPSGMRYCRVVLSTNGRVKPDVVLFNGKEERHPEGAYSVMVGTRSATAETSPIGR